MPLYPCRHKSVDIGSRCEDICLVVEIQSTLSDGTSPPLCLHFELYLSLVEMISSYRLN
jgi:hypothetical protein